MRKYLPIIILVILLTVAALLAGFYVSTLESVGGKNQLLVHFINVGQGNCILVQTPDGRNVLIDSGDENSADYVIKYLHHRNVHRIDALIITHASSEDIGGLPTILKTFGVSQIVDAGCSHITRPYEELLANVRSRRIDYKLATASPSLLISKNVSFEIIWPPTTHGEHETSAYNNCLALQVGYGDVKFLLMEDIGLKTEGLLLSVRQDLQSAVLGAALHGDRESTSNELLQVVQPDYAVISVGDDNELGDPADSTIRRIHATGARVLRTDQNGTIIFTTDGRHLRVVTER